MSGSSPRPPSVFPKLRLRPFAALRDSFADAYKGEDFRADVLAGAVVGIVALPLSMALAIASGVAPQHGLYTAIVAGALIALLGGSRVQVSGPTAAFVVILAPIAAKFGVGGLLVATMLAGFLLIAFAIARLGKLIEYIPYPVTIGFTAGIAVVIATLQIKDLLALEIAKMPEHYVERVSAIVSALPTAHWQDLAIGLGTFAILLGLPRLTRRVPAPLIALSAAALAAYALSRLVPGFDVVTIADKFRYVAADGSEARGIPQLPPLFALPWTLPGPGGVGFELTWDVIRQLLPSAFAIAMLGAIESLLSAVVADGMIGAQHDPDAELLGQGVGNVVAPFFGGIAATGAIARTATNVRSGGRTPIASIVHALVVLASVLVLAPILGYLPMSALAALLLLVAWNMSEAKHFFHSLRISPHSDKVVLLACFGLTVAFDMVVSVSVGVVLASLLFMRRMAELAAVTLVEEHHPRLGRKLPKNVVYYEIAGPLFFGAALRATRALRSMSRDTRAVVLDISSVPAMDATGFVNLESAISRLQKDHVFVVIAGAKPQPASVLAQAGLVDSPGRLRLVADVEQAIAAATSHVTAHAGAA
jgi:sulfate permease, SulP family